MPVNNPIVRGVYTASLGSDVTIINPAITPAFSGTFTPEATAVDVTVDITHIMEYAPGAWASWRWYSGQNSPAVLHPVSQGDALAAGVTKVNLGTVDSKNGTVFNTFRLTGLTPGSPVSWEVCGGVTGGAGIIAAAGVFQVAVSDELAWPDDCEIVAARAQGTIRMFKVYTRFKHEAVALGNYTITDTNGNVAVTPNGKYVVAANLTTDTLHVINTAAPTVAERTVALASQGGLPADPNPYWVVCDPTSTYAYVSCGSRIVRVTLATGVIATSVDLGAGAISYLSISPDGAYIFAATAATGYARLRTSDNNVVALTIASPFFSAGAFTSDSAHIYAIRRSAGATSHLARLNASTLVSENSVALGTVVKPYDLATFGDGAGLLIACDHVGASDQQIQHYLTPSMVRYVEWVNQLSPQAAKSAAYGIAISDKGNIYVTANTQGAINFWFGGAITVDIGNEFFMSKLNVRVDGAQ